MPDPVTPSLGGSDLYVGGSGGAEGTPNMGMAASTNDAMPRFEGMAGPGDRVVLAVDGEPVMYQDADADGAWDLAAPELDDGSYDFELYSENADGVRSDPWEWQTDIKSDWTRRRDQRERNEEWRKAGPNKERLKSTPVSAGSGSTGSKRKVDKPKVSDVEKGNTPRG